MYDGEIICSDRHNIDALDRVMFAMNVTDFIVQLAMGAKTLSIFLVHSNNYT